MSLTLNPTLSRLLLAVGFILATIIYINIPDSDLISKVVIFLCYSFVVVSLGKWNAAHPIVLYSTIFTIYAVAAPVLVSFDQLPYIATYSYALWLHLLALFVFALFGVTRERIVHPLCYKQIGSERIPINIIFILTLFSVVVYLIAVVKLGFYVKQDRAISGHPLAYLGFTFYMFATAATIVVVKKVAKRDKFPYVFVIVVFGFFLVGFLITGERNYLFKYVIAMLVLWQFLTRKLSGPMFVVIITAGLFSASISHFMKGAFLNDWSIPFDEVFKHMLYGEFKSSTRNLAILLDGFEQHGGFSWGGHAIEDLKRAFLPGFLVPRVVETTTVWFNKEYFADFFSRGGGVGFSLVGAGYVNFGIAGVIAVFGLLGYILNRLYIFASRRAIGLIIYCNVLAVFVATIRYDFAGPVSQITKHVLLVILVYWLLSKFILYMKNSNYKKGKIKGFYE